MRMVSIRWFLHNTGESLCRWWRFSVTICVSSSIDIQLIMDLLSHAIRAAKILKWMKTTEIWQEILDYLPPLKIE